MMTVLLPKGRHLGIRARVTLAWVGWWLWWVAGGPPPGLRDTARLLLWGKTGEL